MFASATVEAAISVPVIEPSTILDESTEFAARSANAIVPSKIFAEVIAFAAIVAACDPFPGPAVTSPVSCVIPVSASAPQTQRVFVLSHFKISLLAQDVLFGL